MTIQMCILTPWRKWFCFLCYEDSSKYRKIKRLLCMFLTSLNLIWPVHVAPALPMWLFIWYIKTVHKCTQKFEGFWICKINKVFIHINKAEGITKAPFHLLLAFRLIRQSDLRVVILALIYFTRSFQFHETDCKVF